MHSLKSMRSQCSRRVRSYAVLLPVLLCAGCVMGLWCACTSGWNHPSFSFQATFFRDGPYVEASSTRSATSRLPSGRMLTGQDIVLGSDFSTPSSVHANHYSASTVMHASGSPSSQPSSAWMDCDLSFGTGDTAPPGETWILQGSEFPVFGKFLMTRGVSPSDVSIQCEEQANGASAWGTRACEQCVKLNTGGPYGAAGVVSPAYPLQSFAEGCLALSGKLSVNMTSYDGTGLDALSDESYDGSSNPASFAFCQTTPVSA